MKLGAIFLVWDDWDLLEFSISKMTQHCENVVVVWSEYSNYGELSLRPEMFLVWSTSIGTNQVKFINFEPDLKKSPRDNETFKRNIGLDWIRKTDCTHFLMLDSDEFYTSEDILKGKHEIGESSGLVCRSQVYFKSPTLTIGLDTTLVPFIHKLTPELKFGWNTAYPFAFEGVRREIRIDPTRQLNLTSGVKMCEVVMHHYSWIRKDVRKKVRNSTARNNIERSTIIQDYLDAKEGHFCQFYGKRLEACPNLFGLPEIIDTNVKESE